MVIDQRNISIQIFVAESRVSKKYGVRSSLKAFRKLTWKSQTKDRSRSRLVKILSYSQSLGGLPEVVAAPAES